MRYCYDKYGWYTKTVDTDSVLPNSSSVAIPEIPENSNLWPNYIGNGWELMERKEFEHVVVNYVPPTNIAPWTKLEYMSKFTDEELENIYSAAKSSVQVEIWLEKFKLSQEVYKDDPRVLQGLLALETAGILAVGRANEIVSS